MDTGPMDTGPMDSGPMDAGPMDAGPMGPSAPDDGGSTFAEMVTPQICTTDAATGHFRGS
jgi:hypothetical protein